MRLLLLTILLQMMPFPATVNTMEGEEYGPVVSADGKTLFFTGKNRPDNVGMEDIFYARMEQGQWGRARVVNSLSSPYANEAVTSLSADGSTLFVFKDGRLGISVRTARGWSAAQPFPKELVIASWQADAMLTADGRALLFAAWKEVGWEEKASVNIFVSLLGDDGRWGKPFALDSTINRSGMDRAPVLHPDMRTLYFCSDRPGGKGGLDVWMTRRESDTCWNCWSEPVNLGDGINTPQDECWYQIATDGSEAYFAKRTNRLYDLWRVPLPREMRPQAVAMIDGRVRTQGGSPVHTAVRWEDLETGETIGQAVSDPVSGGYFVALPTGKWYGYFVDDDRYFPIAENVDMRGVDSTMKVTRHITLLAYDRLMATGQPVAIPNLFFETAKATLMPASKPELLRVARVLKEKKMAVTICGHTDAVGKEADNQRLSEQRAEAVRDFLIEAGCAPERLTAVGYGAGRPVADNETEEGRQRNRRVELIFQPITQ